MTDDNKIKELSEVIKLFAYGKSAEQLLLFTRDDLSRHILDAGYILESQPALAPLPLVENDFIFLKVLFDNHKIQHISDFNKGDMMPIKEAIDVVKLWTSKFGRPQAVVDWDRLERVLSNTPLKSGAAYELIKYLKDCQSEWLK